MPLLRITTNRTVDDEQVKELLKIASATVAEMLGKAERYVMVDFVYNPHMIFSGNSANTAYLELKSIGLPVDRTGDFSKLLCLLMQKQLQITEERVYIEFSSAERHLWGWNSATF
ncbi:MAG: phenylpyruvate tautomerase MIF-related protein [Candidatus Thiodiazotropha sp. 'RUGA']|nr:phenylpyruvate tautomerase MIF-related protein [Candidatus Thiodiazotropha sp. 'RUGA']